MKYRDVCGRLCLLAAIVINGGLSTGTASAQDAAAVFAAFEQSVVDLVSRSEKSIVAVARIPFRNERIDRQPARNPFGLPRGFDENDPLSPGFAPQEFGAGILMSPPGHPEQRLILTNYHVVHGGQPFLNDGSVASDARLTVRIDRTRAAWASIYAADPRSDLAVLAVDESELTTAISELPTLTMPEAVDFRKGQFVLALGNPYAIARDGSPSVSVGIISNLSRIPLLDTQRDEKTIHQFGTLLHVDTRLGPGSSGGALLNSSGQLIGITTSLAALEGYESSVGYAIPFNAAMRRIVEDLLNGYEVEYGFLGVQGGGRFGSLRNRNSQGVEIERVVPNSPADRAGLRIKETIRAVNGIRLYSLDDLFREVGLLPPGTNAHLHVISRNGQRFVDVQIGKWPVPDSERIVVSAYRQPAWRGLRVDWPTGRMKFFDQEAPYPVAVVVKSVEPGSPAEAAGLRPGDLIERVAGRPVETPEEFTAAVKRQRDTVRLDLSEDRTVVIRE
ncbi:PDZ domain-containing protein [bacterium]|nr:PDZ domain-containing protein [bacterium]